MITALSGRELTGIRTMDTAATALWLLGVGMPASFEGKAVERAFSLTELAAR